MGTYINVVSFAPGESKSLVLAIKQLTGGLVVAESSQKLPSGDPLIRPLSLKGEMHVLVNLTAEQPIYTVRFHFEFNPDNNNVMHVCGNKSCTLCGAKY